MTDLARERRALALFEALLAVPEADRAAWLTREAGGDAALAARVEAMIQADRLAALQTGGAASTLDDDSLPERIGAYRIVARIGRGGMGAVYKGERDTGDFAHTAAIKLIKPGLLSERLIERFQRERQTLASLEHPYIARLYDGGETAEGAPFIVMEFVDGEPILDWVEERGLHRNERLRLFGHVCEAVAHAHRSLIVHRDITPANVLVTAQGTVKLIDFGIARPAQESGAGEPASSLASLSLTPGFAAPERALSGEATTSGDVYSLGKLLAALCSAEAGERELAAIIARAASPEPVHRYPTVDALHADTEAVRSDMPVAAMGASRRYVLRKFYERHRLGVIASVVALALLVLALAGTAWSLSRAVTAQRAEAARFEQVRSLARYLLFDLNARLSRVAGNTGARADMAGQAQNYLAILSQAAGSERPDLKLETAQGLIQLARIQGSPSEPNLGQTPQAEKNLVSALALLGSLDPAEPEIAAAAATAHATRGQILLNDELRQDQASAEIARARKLVNAAPAGMAARRAVRRAEIDLADLGAAHKTLLTLADQMEADIKAWPAAEQSGRLAALDRAIAAYLRAQAESEAGERLDWGLPLFLAAEKQFDALIAADPFDPVVLLHMTMFLRDAYASASREGSVDVAQRLVFKGDALTERLIALDDRDEGIRKRAGSIKEALAQNLRDHRRYGEAIAQQQRVLALRRANIGPDRNARRVADLGFSQMIMGIIARDAGERALACANWTASEATVGELERRGQLAGFIKDFLPGLREKKQLCADGAPLSALHKPMK